MLNHILLYIDFVQLFLAFPETMIPQTYLCLQFLCSHFVLNNGTTSWGSTQESKIIKTTCVLDVVQAAAYLGEAAVNIYRAEICPDGAARTRLWRLGIWFKLLVTIYRITFSNIKYYIVIYFYI